MLKLNKKLATIVIILFAILLISCSNNKNKLLDYYKKNYEYLEKSQETDLTKKTTELEILAKQAGFKDQNELGEAAIKYFDDTEIKQWTNKIEIIESQLKEKESTEKQKKLEEQFRNQGDKQDPDSILNMDFSK